MQQELLCKILDNVKMSSSFIEHPSYDNTLKNIIMTKMVRTKYIDNYSL